jgi:hypothetical protein
MKTSVSLNAIPNPLVRLLGIWTVVLLLVGTVFSTQPVRNAQAAPLATCTSTADGVLWNNLASWDCGRVPLASDDVVIQHAVTLDISTSVQSLSILTGAGALTFSGSESLTLSGNFTIDFDAIFDPGTGTVLFGNGSQTITTNGKWLDFYNLQKQTPVGPNETLYVDPAVAGEGGIHILNQVTLVGTAANHLFLRIKTGSPAGSKWQIWPVESYVIDYVDVKDSTNVSPTIPTINVNHGFDSGNNVGWGLVGITVTLTTSATPVMEYTLVTFTATLVPAPSTGTVAFKANDIDIANCSASVITSGVATCSVDDLQEGTYTITAVYSGGGNYAPATSNSITQVIGLVVSVSLGTSGNPSMAGTNVTFTANVLPMMGAGTVKFMNNGVAIPGCEAKAVIVPTGRTTCTVNNLPAIRGTHPITAEFTEATTSEEATSNQIDQVIKSQGSVVVTSSISPAGFGAQVKFTATVTPANATGLVTFKVDGVNIPTCVNVSIDAGKSQQAECTYSKLSGGIHSVSATYAGDTYTQGGSSPTIFQVVNMAKFYLPFTSR